MTSRAATPWWAHAFEQQRTALERYVRMRVPAADASDAIADVARALTERLHGSAAAYPASWFGAVEPSADDAAAFAGLLRTIVRARIFDRLRRVYVSARHEKEIAGEVGIAPTHDPGAAIDSQRAVAALAKRIDELSQEDRELLLEGVLPDDPDLGPPAPRPGRDRVRLHRIRRRLAEQVWRDLGMEEK